MAEDDLAAWSALLAAPCARALYVHVPFCVSKCLYCDFCSRPTRGGDPLVGAYVEAIVAQVSELSSAGLLSDVVTGYIGGGTPTIAADGLVRLVGSMSDACRLSELSCEANPESLVKGLPRRLRSRGLTRMSVGIQSLCDEELRALGRIHDSRRALEALTQAVESGLDVSADVMCGIPLQTVASLGSTLSGVMDAGVGHVSVYPLIIEDGTPFARMVDSGRMRTPGDDLEADLMEVAERELLQGGFHRYEVASYALPGRECSHNKAYWSGVPYLGLGQSAASMLTREGYLRLREVAPQLPTLPESTRRVRLTVTSDAKDIAADRRVSRLSFDLELLDERQAAAEDLMLAARKSRGISRALVKRASEQIGSTEVTSTLSGLVSDGLLAPGAEGGLAPTHSGWLLGNELYGRLWNLSEGTIIQRAASPRDLD